MRAARRDRATDVPTRHSLRVRVPATAIAVFAIGLAVATLLAFQLLLQDGKADVQVVIDRELDRFQRSMNALLAEEVAAAETRIAETPAGEAPDTSDVALDADGQLDELAALERAAQRYLALNPATESYWTLIRLENRAEPLRSSRGPALLEDLYARGELPEPTLQGGETLPTASGDVRSVSAPIELGGRRIGSYQILAPLAPMRGDAVQAAWLVAAAAGVSLLLGAVLLTATLWRSLSPLRDLARTARSTELRSMTVRVDEPDTGDEVGLLAREFNSMLARLERASESRTEFMAQISHELRTPITIARGHLELLQSLGRDDPDALDETVEVVEDELRRMGRLVEDLMAIARSDMEGFARPRDVDLVGFFEDVELKLAGLKLGDVRLEPPPPVTLQADPQRLAQAVLNLVTNARLHTPDGTRVRVRAREGDGEVLLIVADDGPGIPASIRDEVFAPFVRASDAPSSTGLGLAVVQAVVTAHGGRVELETSVQGTVFTLHLPYEPVPESTLSTRSAPAQEPVAP